MAYGKTQEEAILRVAIKRKLKMAKIKGWRKDSPTKKLQAKLAEIQ